MPRDPGQTTRAFPESGAQVMAEAAIFTCSICGEPSTEICVYCTKDACGNHRCERCKRCSDCCECEIPLSSEEMQVASETVEPVEVPIETPEASVEAPSEPEPAEAAPEPSEEIPPHTDGPIF